MILKYYLKCDYNWINYEDWLRDKWMDGWLSDGQIRGLGWVDRWMNGWTDEWWMDGWIYQLMNGWMDGWMDGLMDEWMDG